MGLLGSAFGRGLAGGAQAVESIAGKYMDEALAQQRAEAMATLQRKTAGLMRADDDAFENDPNRVQRNRDNKVADVRAVGGAQNETALAGKLAESQSPELRQARIDNENAFVTGTSEVKGNAEAKNFERMTPLMARRAEATAKAEAGVRAQYREQPPSVQKKIDEIEAVLGRKMTEDEKMGALGLIKGRDPELDTETVTEEKMNPDGTVVKTQRKQVRRPGEKSAAEKPPQDVAHAEAQAAIKSGASADAVNARLKSMGYAPLAGAEKPAREVSTRRLPASTERLTEAEWDRRFGKGDFKKQGEYKPGEDSLKAF